MNDVNALERELADLYMEQGFTENVIRLFRHLVNNFYSRHGRSFPWRETSDPYRILVSEIMLQQTQVMRVVPKYTQFTGKFPDFASLAGASVRDVLEVWKGLGYNRRALALLSIAQTVHSMYGNKLPSSPDILVTFPGIGKYTAAAIAAFAFRQPTVFIETNIRTVYLHHFFPAEDGVPDSRILPLIEKALDRNRPREWYYALMDYGAVIKETANHGRRSASWRRQSPFKGSNRELRSTIVSLIMEGVPLSEADIIEKVGRDPSSVCRNLVQLQKEGFLTKKGDLYNIPGT